MKHLRLFEDQDSLKPTWRDLQNVHKMWDALYQEFYDEIIVPAEKDAEEHCLSTPIDYSMHGNDAAGKRNRYILNAIVKFFKKHGFSIDWDLLERRMSWHDFKGDYVENLTHAFKILRNDTTLSKQIILGDKLRNTNVASGVFENDRKSYLKWKRRNVTLRGEIEPGQENGNRSNVLGEGLYSAALSNYSMAKKYGNVRFLVNAIPKHPKKFNTLNEWEIYRQQLVIETLGKYDRHEFDKSHNVRDIMLKKGYDGVIIIGREMVNYTPENVMYYKNDVQLYDYYTRSLSMNESFLTKLWNPLLSIYDFITYMKRKYYDKESTLGSAVHKLESIFNNLEDLDKKYMKELADEKLEIDQLFAEYQLEVKKDYSERKYELADLIQPMFAEYRKRHAAYIEKIIMTYYKKTGSDFMSDVEDVITALKNCHDKSKRIEYTLQVMLQVQDVFSQTEIEKQMNTLKNI